MEVFKMDEEKIKELSLFMKEILEPNSSLVKKQIYEKYESIIDTITPLDLFHLDMYKQGTTYSIDEIKATADKFVNVFHQRLEQYEIKDYQNSFFKYFYQESFAIDKHLDSLKPYFKKKKINENKEVLRRGFEKCLEIDKKFLKKENILFPNLEKIIPSTIPLEVMWALHDDARRILKEILIELNKETTNELDVILLIGEYYYTMYGINQKEQLILYPVAVTLVSDKILRAMFEESFEYGYALIEVFQPLHTKSKSQLEFRDGLFKTNTGTLNLKELDLVLNYIPLDITFVDRDDRVRYFNSRKERHFPRNPSIIGRLVKHCHPPKSVKIVEGIVESFKQGKKDFEEFWITFNKVMLYITYYAVRDEDNNYIGVLEVSQDVTHIKSLRGEKRLWRITT